MDIKDTIDTWRPGDAGDLDAHITDPEQREEAAIRESYVVKTGTGVAICDCYFQEDAVWIAKRLNMAARLERFIELYFHGEGS